jgi:demethylmenaquinone methyltransferase/2-methoxy-6-polyprenyl-1,4-benzoquinol methylase
MVKPYQNSEGSKKEQVAQMFDSIAFRYDFLNHFLSLGIDKLWRKKAISKLKKRNISSILDIATGTGDLAIAASKLKNVKITGIDISEKMLEIGRAKIEKLRIKHIIDLQKGDSEKIIFTDNSFDAITVAFGVRNFENLQNGLQEMFRVLKPGGIAVVLEFSKPKAFPFKQIYQFYFRYFLPLFGKFVSKNSSAYTYLPESVQAFPDGNEFLGELRKAGFEKVSKQIVTFGVSTIYTGEKI